MVTPATPAVLSRAPAPFSEDRPYTRDTPDSLVRSAASLIGRAAVLDSPSREDALIESVGLLGERGQSLSCSEHAAVEPLLSKCQERADQVSQITPQLIQQLALEHVGFQEWVVNRPSDADAEDNWKFDISAKKIKIIAGPKREDVFQIRDREFTSEIKVLVEKIHQLWETHRKECEKASCPGARPRSRPLTPTAAGQPASFSPAVAALPPRPEIPSAAAAAAAAEFFPRPFFQGALSFTSLRTPGEPPEHKYDPSSSRSAQSTHNFSSIFDRLEKALGVLPEEIKKVHRAKIDKLRLLLALPTKKMWFLERKRSASSQKLIFIKIPLKLASEEDGGLVLATDQIDRLRLVPVQFDGANYTKRELRKKLEEELASLLQEVRRVIAETPYFYRKIDELYDLSFSNSAKEKLRQMAEDLVKPRLQPKAESLSTTNPHFDPQLNDLQFSLNRMLGEISGIVRRLITLELVIEMTLPFGDQLKSLSLNKQKQEEDLLLGRWENRGSPGIGPRLRRFEPEAALDHLSTIKTNELFEIRKRLKRNLDKLKNSLL